MTSIDTNKSLHDAVQAFRDKYGPFAHVEDVNGELVVIPYKVIHCVDGSTWRISTYGVAHRFCRHVCTVSGLRCYKYDYIVQDTLDNSYYGIVNSVPIIDERGAIEAIVGLSPYVAEYSI